MSCSKVVGSFRAPPRVAPWRTTSFVACRRLPRSSTRWVFAAARGSRTAATRFGGRASCSGQTLSPRPSTRHVSRTRRSSATSRRRSRAGSDWATPTRSSPARSEGARRASSPPTSSTSWRSVCGKDVGSPLRSPLPSRARSCFATTWDACAPHESSPPKGAPSSSGIGAATSEAIRGSGARSGSLGAPTGR